MKLSLSSTLAAVLLTGDAFVNAACPPPGVYRHRHSVRPAGATPAFPWPSAFSIPAVVVPSSPAIPVPVPSPSSTLATVVVPEVTTTTPLVSSTSSTAVVAATTATPTPAASSSASSLTADQQAALDAQNGARSDAGAAPMAWDAGLAGDAQTWADHLAAQSSAGSLEHDMQSGEGENLYWQSNSGSPYKNAAAAWVAEKGSYSGEAIGSGSSFESYGHYTQIIWSSTTKVGMAVSSDGQGGYYVVARYSPAGNVIGETPSSG